MNYFNYAVAFYLPACYINTSLHKEPINPILSTFGSNLISHEESYQRYQMYVQEKLNSSLFLKSGNKHFLVQPEDAYLIEKICADNPHKSAENLLINFYDAMKFHLFQQIFD